MVTLLTKSLGLVSSLGVVFKSIIGGQFASFMLLISLLWLYTIYNKFTILSTQFFNYEIHKQYFT